MPIDPLKDKLIPINDVAARFPRAGGKPTNKNTVRRWVDRGCRGVKLEAVHIGAQLCTTEECLRAFLEAINPDMTPAPKRTPEEVEARQLAIEKELAEFGIPSF
jgi:Protein of unknown function (DUF1580)